MCAIQVPLLIAFLVLVHPPQWPFRIRVLLFFFSLESSLHGHYHWTWNSFYGIATLCHYICHPGRFIYPILITHGSRKSPKLSKAGLKARLHT